MSKPLNYFNSTIARARSLLDIDTDDAIQDDLARSAAVLGVAAYDHYFTSKFCDVLASNLKSNSPSKELVQILERAGLDAKTALEICVMNRPFRRIRTLVTRSFSGKTTNRTKAIESLFSAIDLPGLSGRVKKETGRKNLEVRIDKLVSIRNDIVHHGHLNSHGKPKSISSLDIANRLSEVELFIKTAEDIITGHIASKNLPALSSSTE